MTERQKSWVSFVIVSVPNTFHFNTSVRLKRLWNYPALVYTDTPLNHVWSVWSRGANVLPVWWLCIQSQWQRKKTVLHFQFTCMPHWISRIVPPTIVLFRASQEWNSLDKTHKNSFKVVEYRVWQWRDSGLCRCFTSFCADFHCFTTSDIESSSHISRCWIFIGFLSFHWLVGILLVSVKALQYLHLSDSTGKAGWWPVLVSAPERLVWSGPQKRWSRL